MDLQNYDNVRFLASIGTLANTGTLALKLQTGRLPDGSDMADVPGCATDVFTGDGTAGVLKYLSLDVIQTRGMRYARVVLTRGVANASVNEILAELYDNTNIPCDPGDVVSRKVARGG